MIDLLTAAQTAVFAALSARTELTALSPVHQHVPQDTEPPLTIVGKIDSEAIGGKYQQLEDITIEVVAVHRGAGRAALLAIMHQQREALDGQAIAASGAEFDTVEFVAASADGPADDGLTYAGISIFKVKAQPA